MAVMKNMSKSELSLSECFGIKYTYKRPWKFHLRWKSISDLQQHKRKGCTDVKKWHNDDFTLNTILTSSAAEV